MTELQVPLVSVVTPVYNGEEFLGECIESVLAQTYSNWEYIIVNNCSTDRTLEIASEYAKKDSRIRVHSNGQFVGVMENHNTALNLISPAAKYCKVVCADDFILPECVLRMVDCAEANPSIGLVGSYSLAGKKIMWNGLEYDRKVVRGSEISRATLLGGPYVFGSPTSLLYRADLVRGSRAFYPNSSPHSDTTACYKLLEQSDFGFVHHVLSYTRIHPNSQTSQSIELGTIQLAVMRDLSRFGPKYLTASEINKRFEYLMGSYYRVLVHVILKHSGKKEFWQEQKAALKEIGLRLSLLKLLTTVLSMAFGLLLRPRVALNRVLAIRRGTGKGEGRYYQDGN